MTSDILEREFSIESAFRSELGQRKLQRRRERLYDILACVAVIVFYGAMFLLIKLCLEIGLQTVVHEVAEHVRIPRGV